MRGTLVLRRTGLGPRVSRKSSAGAVTFSSYRTASATADSTSTSYTDDDDRIQIHCLETDVVTQATPGTMLSEVAEQAGVVVSYGCGSGQCGMCEMEIKKYSLEKEKDSALGIVVRSCVTPVPRNVDFKFWEVSEFVDSIWGQ